jgi:hypothetical protein
MPRPEIVRVLRQNRSKFRGTEFATDPDGGTAMIRSAKATFESIESAHAYVGLLREAVDEAARMIEQETETPREFTDSRHLDALRLVHYKLHSLGEHLIVSRRLLSDLRMLRRYLLDERTSEHAVNQKSSHSTDQSRSDQIPEQV